MQNLFPNFKKCSPVKKMDNMFQIMYANSKNICDLKNVHMFIKMFTNLENVHDFKRCPKFEKEKEKNVKRKKKEEEKGKGKHKRKKIMLNN